MDQYDEILKNDAFKNVSKEVLVGLKETMRKMEGKSMAESMAILMQFSNSIPKSKPLTAEEQNAMKMAIFQTLNDEDKAKFQKIIQMIEMMNR